jgi:glycosyltransferase involved in cell wall biosynthesis
MPAAGPSLLVLDEGLQSRTGHFFEYDRSIRVMCQRRGMRVVIAAHAQAEAEVVTELGAVPWFTHTNWGGVYYKRLAPLRWLGVFTHNFRTLRQSWRIIRRQGPVDVVFVPATALHHLFALRLLLAFAKRLRFRRVVIFLRLNFGRYVPGQERPEFGIAAKALGLALRTFRGSVAKGRVVLGTDSGRLADEFLQLAGVQLRTFPCPLPAMPPPPARWTRGQPVTFGILGTLRWEKGVDLLQAAIRELLADEAFDARFVLHWNRPVAKPDGTILAPDPCLVASPKVKFLTEDLASGAYMQHLAACHVVVLPYRRSSYRARTSAVALEAMTSGIPVICTDNSWMGDELRRHGAGFASEDENVADLVAKMRRAAQEIEALQEEAARRAPEARRWHSEERFLECLFS